MCVQCEGWVTRDREATSYPDQLIYKSNQRESMTGTSIQSGSSVTGAVKETEEGRETDATHTQQHFKNQEIFNSNQIRKNIERHDKMVTTIHFFFL